MTLTGLVFMLVFLGALVLALVRNPMYGLFAYIGEFYLHPPSRWWGEFLPDLRWSMLAAIVTLIAILARAPPDSRLPWYKTTPGWLLIAFIVWFWITGLWALDPSVHVPAAVLMTKYVLVFYMVYRLIDTPAKVTAFLMAHICGCFYLGILAFGSDPSTRLDGVGGPGINDSNTLSMHLDTGVMAAAMLVLHLRDWRRYVSIGAAAFACNAIVLCGSRGAFLALVAGGLVLYYLRPVAYKKMFYVFAILGIALFLRVASAGFWNRMDTVTAAASGDEAIMDNSAASRLEMAKAQLKMAERFPFGAGHRGSEVLSSQYLAARYMTEGGARSSHNAFLTILVEQGLPGTAIYLVFIFWTGGTLRKLKRTTATRNPTPEENTLAVHAAAIGGALTVVLVGEMFADFSKCEVQIWMIALLASIAQTKLPVRGAESEKAAPAPPSNTLAAWHTRSAGTAATARDR